MDPRTVSTATEMAEFTVPGNWDYVEVLNFGVNLPPVQGVPNNYEQPIGTKPEPVTVNINIGNQPTDNSLPTKKSSTKKSSSNVFARGNIYFPSLTMESLIISKV